MAQVRDQGDRPTCLAFAVTATHELARAGAPADHENLSEEALYWGCKQIDGNQDAGSSLPSVEDALQRWGQPLEQVWPYEPHHDDSQPSSPPGGRAGGSGWRRARLRSIGPTPGALKTKLAGGRGVALGLRLFGEFFTPTDGSIQMPAPGGPEFGLHAVTIAGYDDPSGIFIIRNSWGAAWGNQGFGYLPYAYVERYGLAACAVEELLAESEGKLGGQIGTL